MSWVRVEDSFPLHPKVLRAGPMAAYLFVAGLCFCQRMATSGLISGSNLAHVAPELGHVARLAARLVEVGLWEWAGPDGQDYQVHDWSDYNLTREEVLRRRALAKQRQDRFRLNRLSRRDNAVNHALQRRDSTRDNAVSNATPYPYPIKTTPNGVTGEEVTALQQAQEPAARPPDAGLYHAYPPALFRADCPDRRWHGRCVDTAYLDAHPDQRYPALDPHGSPKRCPTHRLIPWSPAALDRPQEA